MSPSTFDPSAFMNQTVDQAGSTDWVLCPEGEYPAMIELGEPEKLFRTSENKDKTGTFTTCSPGFIIQDGKVQQLLERDKVVVYHKGVFLDFDANGNLDMGKGKNVGLNQIRDAVGQNVAGQAWNISMLNGAGPVMVKVVHETNKNNPEQKFARVTKVTKIS